jgi:glutamine synthetase
MPARRTSTTTAASGAKRVRVLFPDHLGLARGKYLPTPAAAAGTRHCVSLYALGFDRTMVPAPGSRLLEGLPDIELTYDPTDVRPGWEPQTDVVVGDLSFRGEPFELSARHALKRSVDQWSALGFQTKVGIELEAFVLQPDGNGGWTEWNTPGAYVYGTGRAVDPVGLIDKIMTTAEACGLPLESVNSEYDTPQFEFTLVYDDAVKAVDDVFVFKLMAREIAAEFGLLLTFLGKPFGDRGGSGFHVNFSFLNKRGTNALVDAKGEDGLSDLTRGCVAGLLHHHRGRAALVAPTVNAYKRLRPGQLAGYFANWGHDHRGVTVRLPVERGRSTRIEDRMADGAANPYITTATTLQAARLGYVNKMTPPPAEVLDSLETASTDVVTPANLREALVCLEADTALSEAVGADLVANFLAVKTAEWEKFDAAVTDWELKQYLPFL